MSVRRYFKIISEEAGHEKELAEIRASVIQIIRERRSGELDGVRVRGDELVSELNVIRSERAQLERAIATGFRKARPLS